MFKQGAGPLERMMVVAAVLTYLLAILLLLGGMLAATPGAVPNAAVVSAQASEPSPGAQPAADWQRILPGGRMVALVANPTDPTRLYAAGFETGRGTQPNIYASQDGGSTWVRVGRPDRVSFVSLAVGRDGTVYLAASHGGIHKSLDGGITWRAVYEAGGIGGIAADPADPANVYAIRGGGRVAYLLASHDHGETWTSSAVPIPCDAGEIAVDWDAGVLYLGGGCGLLRTTDFGESWSELAIPSTVAQLATNPARPGQVFAVVTSEGLWISDDAGESWTVASEPRFIHRLALDPRDPSGATFAFAAGNHGVEAPVPENIFWTTDRGASWRPLGAPPTRSGDSAVPKAMRIAGDSLFVLTNSGLWATSLPPAP